VDFTDSSAATSSVAQKCAPLGCEPLEATRCNFAPVGPRDKRALRKMCSDLDAPENALELARHHVTASQPPTRQTPMRQEDVFQFFGCPSHPPCPISLETSSSVAESAALPTSSSPCGSRQRPLELAEAQAMSKSSGTHAHPRGACASTCGENEGLPSCLAMRHGTLARNNKDFQIRTDSILSLTMTDERLHDIVRHLADHQIASPRTPTKSGGDSLRRNIVARSACETF